MQICPPVVTLHSAFFGALGATGFEQAETARAAAARMMAAILLRRMGLPRECSGARNELHAR